MIVVTASSFMKNQILCAQLEATFPLRKIRYIPNAELSTITELSRSLSLASGWLIGRESCNSDVISCLSNLKVVSKYGVGLDNIEVDACLRQGIQVYCEAGINKDSVAEHTLGLMIATLRNIAINSHKLRDGEWNKSGGFNLTGKKVGIVGLGHVGTRVAELLKVFRCEVGYFDIMDRSHLAVSMNLRALSFEQLLSWSDVISFHVPLTKLTRDMLNERTMSITRKGVYIINTSRGAVINQQALKKYMLTGHISGVGLDVFESEPLRDNELYSMDSFVGTPHTAGNSQEAVMAMGQAAIRGLKILLA